MRSKSRSMPLSRSRTARVWRVTGSSAWSRAALLTGGVWHIDICAGQRACRCSALACRYGTSGGGVHPTEGVGTCRWRVCRSRRTVVRHHRGQHPSRCCPWPARSWPTRPLRSWCGSARWQTCWPGPGSRSRRRSGWPRSPSSNGSRTCAPPRRRPSPSTWTSRRRWTARPGRASWATAAGSGRG
ncbi:hypothetical protein [Ornithinimicrobium kibberense]|uniref:hypothetical protein n=1 Tax=Ornithinimicrobium kibberense TaxID=282060 RepID=UPI00361B3745